MSTSRTRGWVLLSISACLVGVFSAFVAFGWHLVVTQPLERAPSLQEAYAVISVPVVVVSLGIWLGLSVTVMSLVVHFQKERGGTLRGRPWLVVGWLVSDAAIGYAVTAFFSFVPWAAIGGQLESLIPSDLVPRATRPYIGPLLVMLFAIALAVALQILVRRILNKTAAGRGSSVPPEPGGEGTN